MPPKPTAAQRDAQLSLGALGGIHLAPEVLEEQRGAWCSPLEYTKAAGRFDIDPFSNPRSTVQSLLACWLERGDDAFGLERRCDRGVVWMNKGTPGRPNWTAEISELPEGRHVYVDANYTVWLQPPYDLVLEALAHFGHARFCALLRLDTSTKWFAQLWELSEVIMVPKEDRLEFVPPPGVKASSNPFPHGLYYKRAADVPEAVKALCYPWPTPSYPWAADPLRLLTPSNPLASVTPVL